MNGTPATTSTNVDREPIMGSGSVPTFIILLVAILIYAGMLYLDRTAAEFSAEVYKPYDTPKFVANMQPKSDGDDILAEGAKVYDVYCKVCHQPTGLGSPGQFPPLAGSEWVLAEGPNRIIRIVLNGAIGPIQVKGQPYNNNMLAWRDALSDQQIAAVLSYVRGNKEWGNGATRVTPAMVKKVREETASRTSYWTAAELEQVAPKD